MSSPDEAAQRSSGLLVRIFSANLVVIAVTAATAIAVGWTFGPWLLERHVGSMMPLARQAPGFERMAADLAAAYREALVQSLAWAVAVATLSAGWVAWFIAKALIAPLRALQEASAALAAGRQSVALNVHAPGEIGALARSFESMSGALQQAEEVRQQLLNDLSHELRTPLSNLQGYIEGLEDGVFENDRTTHEALRRQVERIERLVSDLGSLRHLEVEPMSLTRGLVDLHEIVRASIATFAVRFQAQGVELRADVADEALMAEVDSVRSGQALENLLLNALRHTPSGGRVEVSVARRRGEGVVTVADSGPGVPEGEREAIFRRLYRGDPARSEQADGGSGLGLTIAKALVERQGGRMGVHESPDGGAAFWFTVPLAP